VRRRERVLVALALCQLGCAAFSAEVSVAERPLPERFDAPDAGAESSAAVPWRSWFPEPALVALLDEGLKENLDLAMALQRIERTQATATTGALFPRLDATLGAGVRRFGLYTMDGAGNATTDITPGQRVPEHLGDFAIGLQTSWEVDVWGKLRSQREASLAQVLASVEGAHLVQTTLVADLATGWYELVALDRAVEVLAQAATRQAEALEVVRLQKEAGRASELAVQQFEAQLADTRALEVETRQRRLELENGLNVLLGRFPRPIARPQALTFEPLAVAAGLPSELLRNRADVRRAELEVRAARFDLQAARAAFFPSLNLTAGLGVQAFNPAFFLRLPESLAYSVLGGLVAPLINRSGIEAQFQGAKAAQLEAMYGYQKVVLVAFSEATTALAGVDAAARVLALKQEQRAALERSIETAQLLFGAGRASYLEVLFAQQAALQADLELIEAWRRHRASGVLAYKALGGGWAPER
jgi:NodT family efflux transporter outer membrane factor (OMF) lipoprotein